MTRSARLGIFVFLAIVIFGIAVFLVGSKQFLFRDTYRVSAGFQTVSGLAEGAEVRIGGVRVGTVAAINMPQKPGQAVNVDMDLDTSTHRLVKKDSVASIQTEGLLGNKFVSISIGTEASAAIRNGDTIAGSPPLDLSDLIAKTGDILNTTASTLSNMDAATGNLKDITDKINSGEGTLGELVNNKSMYQALNSTAGNLSKTAQEAKAGASGFKENMDALKQNWFFRGYYKKRGYTDPAELTRYAISDLPKSPASKTFTVKAKDIFKGTNADLKHEKKLDPIGKYLEENPFSLAVVTAYGDMKGDSEEDKTLTEARAAIVRDYLVQNYKLDDTRLKTKGLGKQPPNGSRPDEGIEVFIYQNNSRNDAISADSTDRQK
jgi:phospholipid/cholesterol/gamma-HCH transport system substrate-binding protein